MKIAVTSAAFILAASMALSDEVGMRAALEIDPIPCGDEDAIVDANFEPDNDDRKVLRIECRRGVAWLRGTAPPGAPATGFVPAIGFLGPVIGLGVVGVAGALGSSGEGSSTPDTQ